MVASCRCEWLEAVITADARKSVQMQVRDSGDFRQLRSGDRVHLHRLGKDTNVPDGHGEGRVNTLPPDWMIVSSHKHTLAPEREM